MKILPHCFLLNSVYPHFPQETRSLCVAMKTPGPHLGHVGLVLVSASPSTLYASFFEDVLDFASFFAAIQITPVQVHPLQVQRVPLSQYRSSSEGIRSRTQVRPLSNRRPLRIPWTCRFRRCSRARFGLHPVLHVYSAGYGVKALL